MLKHLANVFKWILVSLVFLTSWITYVPFNQNSTNKASAVIVDNNVNATISIEVVEKDDGSKVKRYTFNGLKINDKPNVFNGYSVQDMYEQGKAGSTISDAVYKLIIDQRLMINKYAAHTGWSAKITTYTGGKWVSQGHDLYYEAATKDGYADTEYSYNQVSEGLAALSSEFDDDLRNYFDTIDRNAKLFVVKNDSRNQTHRKWPRTDQGESSALFYPATAKTNPKEGDWYILYYDNDVYVDAEFTVDIPCTDCETTEELCPSTGLPLPCPKPVGSCEIEVSITNGTVMNKSNTTASPNGSIYSSSGEFNVSDGIPTSEDLSVKATAEEYLYDQSFQQKNGTVKYTIKYTQEVTYKWTEKSPGEATEGEAPPADAEESKEETETVETTVEVERPFSYWEVKKFDIWKADHAVFTNYALPNGTATATGAFSVSANAKHDSVTENHLQMPECPATELPAKVIEGGDTKPDKSAITEQVTDEAKTKAESDVGQVKAKNDYVTFKGNTLMSDSFANENAPTPSNIPNPSYNSVTKTNMKIDSSKTNYYQSPSTGVFKYNKVFSLGSISTKSIPFSVNNVTVHTPTVIYASTSDDKEYDQRINPPLRSTPIDSNTEIAALILDRQFTVKMSTKGEHRYIAGYGNRDYQKYIKEKMVKFPFDVYSETKQSYYPANTWIKVPADMQEAKFYMPVWVTEGRYTVEFKAVAENAPATNGLEEKEANKTIPNGTVAGNPSAAHTAIDKLQVDVVGRLYDIEITDVTDHNWQYMFRGIDNLTPTGNKLNVGLKDIDGDERGNVEPYTLPLSHASNTNGLINNAVKLGYTFKFDLKTKGDMQSIKDAIRIKPTFYFVSENGRDRQEVDLYYNDNQNIFVKIGSEQDNIYREVRLNETSRFVPANEISNNAYHYFDFAEQYNLEEIAKDYFRTGFATHYLRSMSKEPVKTGPYAWQLLNWNLRTYRGPSADIVGEAATMIPKEHLVTKEQTWYGEYSLPSQTYAIPKGTDLASAGAIDDTHSIFLKNGYIVVNFDVETINEGDTENPYLSYTKAHYMSQWALEGGKTQFTDGYGNDFVVQDGDMIYYHANKSVEHDFTSSVTH